MPKKSYIKGTSDLSDVIIYNPNKGYGRKITDITSYFWLYLEYVPHPTLDEALKEVRKHFKDDTGEYSHIELDGVKYSI